MFRIKKIIQEGFKIFGIYISKVPLKYYYEVENSVLDNLVKSSTGVLHIGAHYGQEATTYNEFERKVIWIEAVPDVFKILSQNISKFPNQMAICALLGDREIPGVEIFLSNNDFSASSIFDLHPNSGFTSVVMEKKISLPMTTLDNALAGIDIQEYSHWILDVQGAELLVLKGASQNLPNCKSLVVEISSRPTYTGGVQYDQLKEFLLVQGFCPLWEPLKNDHTNIPFIRKQ